MDRLAGGGPDTAAQGMAFQIVASADGSSRRFSYVSPSCEALNGVSAEAAKADPSGREKQIQPE